MRPRIHTPRSTQATCTRLTVGASTEAALRQHCMSWSRSRSRSPSYPPPLRFPPNFWREKRSHGAAGAVDGGRGARAERRVRGGAALRAVRDLPPRPARPRARLAHRPPAPRARRGSPPRLRRPRRQRRRPLHRLHHQPAEPVPAALLSRPPPRRHRRLLLQRPALRPRPGAPLRPPAPPARHPARHRRLAALLLPRVPQRPGRADRPQRAPRHGPLPGRLRRLRAQGVQHLQDPAAGPLQALQPLQQVRRALRPPYAAAPSAGTPGSGVGLPR